MKYTAEFYSISEKLYKIEIDVTRKSGADKTFILSGTPFVSSISSDDKHIYAPIRCGGATIGILTDSFISDFYTGEPKGNKVTLINESDGNKVEWIGYVTPSVYSQGFDENIEQLEIDCVDGVAVLKDIPYRPDSDAQIKTFAQIIFKCLKESGVYNTFYISDNVQFTNNGVDSVIEKLRITENNFKDDDTNGETIDDVAWSCYDVLFEICQFLGYTLITEGNEVFIIDYDAIKAGNNKYFKYSLSGATIGSATSVNVSYSKYIDGADYAANGSNLEMTPIYNKVTVKDNFNLFKSIFPSYDDINYQTNITPATDNVPTGNNLKWSTIAYEERNGKKDYFYLTVWYGWRSRYYAVVLRFYDNALFDMRKYTSTTDYPLDNTSDSKWQGQCKLSDMLQYNGAYYYRIYTKEISGSDFNNFKSRYPYNNTNDKVIEIFKEMCGVTKFDVKPITLFKNGGKRIGSGDGVHYNNKLKPTDKFLADNYPYMVLKQEQGDKVFGGANAQIRITGSFLHHDEEHTPFPLSNGKDNGKLKREGDTKDADEGYFHAKLKWGNQYWNGTTWTTADSVFPIYYWTKNISRDNRKNKNIYDKWFSFCNPDSSQDEPMEYVIPCPSGYNLQGNVEMQLFIRDMHGDSRRSHWHPDGTKGNNRYARYFTKIMCLKDFDVIPEIVSDIVDDGAGETDTIYTNVIPNGAVEKMEEIEFKICTDDNKKPNYSAVDYLDSTGKSQYVKTLYNKALRAKENGSVGTDQKSDGALRQEEHYIFKLATQYENPMLTYECNLHNDDHKLYGTYTDKTLSGKTFILVERDIDYRFNSVRLKMTEKF